MHTLLALCFFIAFAFGNEATIDLGSASACIAANRTHYVATVGWTIVKNPPKVLYLTVFNPKCLDTNSFCDSVDVSETENCGKPLTYEVSNRIVQKVFLPIESGDEVIRYVALHDKPNVCSWGYQTFTQAHPHFLSYGQLSCNHHPTTVPNLNYLYIGLGLLLVFVFVAIVIRKIRGSCAKKSNDNCCVATINSSDSNIPLYDMSADNQFRPAPVDIFPQYPMMYSNDGSFIGQGSQVINIDPVQSLTPVYTQTYSQPGIH